MKKIIFVLTIFLFSPVFIDISFIDSSHKALAATTYPTYTVDANVTTDTTDIVAALKTIHSELPALVQPMITTVNIYQASDNILGSSGGTTIKMNQQYIKTPIDFPYLRDVYTHETSHVVDSLSFQYPVFGANLFDGKQEIGRYNYITGNTLSPSSKIVAPGYRNTNLIKLSPNAKYIMSTENANQAIIVLYDANKTVTRFDTIANALLTTRNNEYYANVYTVSSTINLNTFKIYQTSDRVSLSRTPSFKALQIQRNYPVGSYYESSYEAFADLLGKYMEYKAGKITLGQVSPTNGQEIIDYFTKIEENKFKILPTDYKSLDQMPNPVVN